MGLSAPDRRARLRAARLYLVCDRRAQDLLPALLEAGVDMVQLRDKQAADEDLLESAAVFRRCCDDARAIFVLNDRPDLAVQADADGVHLGQDDLRVDDARALVGEDRIIGLSTHGRRQLDAVRGADYVAVGPVHATPTKPGRPAIGLDPIRYAARNARLPWFAIGGIDASTIGEVLAAGARRVVVVRAITQAADPAAAARELRTRLETAALEAQVGAA